MAASPGHTVSPALLRVASLVEDQTPQEQGGVVDITLDELVDAFRVGRSRHTIIYWAMRRGIEFALSAAMLLPLVPLFLLIAMAIKLEDGGPVFFMQVRLGERLRLFHILKFRTMLTQAANTPAPILDAVSGKMRRPSISEDPRITRVGKFLRHWSLDEIPQVINILLGHMSFVGPRPLSIRESLDIPKAAMVRYSVPAGLTGLAQIRNRESVWEPSRFEGDIEYVGKCGLAIDLTIIARTLGSIKQL